MRSTSSPSTNSGGVTVSLHACRLHWSIDNVEREFYLHMWNFCGGFFVNAKTLSRAKTHLLSRNIGPLAIVRKRGKPFMYGTFVDFIWKLDVFRMSPVIYHRAHIVLVLFRRDFVLFFVHLTTTSFIVAPFPSGFFSFFFATVYFHFFSTSFAAFPLKLSMRNSVHSRIVETGNDASELNSIVWIFSWLYFPCCHCIYSKRQISMFTWDV